MNIPNILTILRFLLVPVFVAVAIYVDDPAICGLVTAGVFIITSLTDMLDGKIARKYNMVTTFGKVMDPLADKFMVFMALITITVKFFFKAYTMDLSGAIGGGVNEKVIAHVLLWVTAIVVLRELGVTSIRLVSSNAGGGVIPANFFGKAKTVTQVIAIVVVLVEFALNLGFGLPTLWIASYISLAVMTFMTVASGINYLKAYSKYLNPRA
ncbi:MAG: CDP-alcohol phosphatidyltransferase family protein [Clostridia bacterium]|nr:CDP-alcohol phosphatidyltransferase family protein [Clostridia bacterium]MBR2943947.1 CDP-alcohol phosphatidyltransferase family protein [Clostridia bacterium]